MDLSPEQKINMSLEDLIAAKNQSTKQKRQAKQGNGNANKPEGQKNGLTITKPRRLAGVAKVNRSNVRRSNRRPASADSNNTKENVVAKSVGANRANRNANINQRRGLNNTGKASKMEVSNEVNKEKSKRSGGGLKITFKPGELRKTTDRAVSQQIRAVLSRQTNRVAKNSSSQSVGSASTNSNNSRRNGPKVRGKNTVLHVKH